MSFGTTAVPRDGADGNAKTAKPPRSRELRLVSGGLATSLAVTHGRRGSTPSCLTSASLQLSRGSGSRRRQARRLARGRGRRRAGALRVRELEALCPAVFGGSAAEHGGGRRGPRASPRLKPRAPAGAARSVNRGGGETGERGAGRRQRDQRADDERQCDPSQVSHVFLHQLVGRTDRGISPALGVRFSRLGAAATCQSLAGSAGSGVDRLVGSINDPKLNVRQFCAVGANARSRPEDRAGRAPCTTQSPATRPGWGHREPKAAPVIRTRPTCEYSTVMGKIIGNAVVMALFAALAGSMPAAAAAQPASPVGAVSPLPLAPAAPAPARAAAGAQAAAGDADVPPAALGYLLDDGVFTRSISPGPTSRPSGTESTTAARLRADTWTSGEPPMASSTTRSP